MKSCLNLYAPSEQCRIPMDIKVWSGGEVGVRIGFSAINSYPSEFDIEASIIDSDGVFALMQIVDIIRSTYPDAKINLYMPYIPYARQDRICNDGESFSLKIFTNLINGMNLDSVFVLDPHSAVSVALLNNCKIIPVKHYLDAISNKGNWVVVAPDAGAVKRADAAASILECPVVYANKVRDPLSGNIVGGRLYLNDVNIEGKDLLVVDDICDGGRTFISLAEMIKSSTSENYRSLNALFSHGIFSYGTTVLKEYYDKIFVINMFDHSMLDEQVIRING